MTRANASTRGPVTVKGQVALADRRARRHLSLILAATSSRQRLRRATDWFRAILARRGQDNADEAIAIILAAILDQEPNLSTEHADEIRKLIREHHQDVSVLDLRGVAA